MFQAFLGIRLKAGGCRPKAVVNAVYLQSSEAQTLVDDGSDWTALLPKAQNIVR